MALPTELPLDNDLYLEVGPIVGLDLDDGAEVLMTGWTDVKAKVCATEDWDAAPLDVTLEVTLTEEQAGSPPAGTAVYRGSLEGSNLSAHLEPYVEQAVYLHVYRQSDYHVVVVLTVRAARLVA